MANKKYNKIGDKIFELRKVKDISQDDLARRVGVSRQTMIKWEANQAYPKADKLQRLCDIFDVGIECFLSKGESLEEFENECEAVADAEVVCAEAVGNFVEESIPQPNNTQDKKTKRKKKKKKRKKKKKKRKLSKKAKITIIATVASIVLLLGIILLIINMLLQPHTLEGSFVHETSITWNFDMEFIGWVIFSITMVIALILGIISVCRIARNKKCKNKEVNDVKS